MEDTTTTTAGADGLKRVQAVVALRLLEALRDRDLPGDLLEDEDPTRTMPRRFGLSGVVDRQIKTYREDVRRGSKLTVDEVSDLFRLVVRRPDGPEVFRQVGRLLVVGDRSGGWLRLLPRALGYRRARKRARKRLKRLFGRPVGGFRRAPFVIEGRGLLFIESDPGGSACHLLSGFCEEILEQTFGGTAEVRHAHCQARGDDMCRWEGALVQARATVVAVPETKGDDEESD